MTQAVSEHPPKTEIHIAVTVNPQKKPRMDKMTDTGEKQAKAGRGGNIPPVDTRFGGARANRRNNKGRPKSFDALRKLAQQIAAEELQSTDGEVITRIEALLRVMSTSRNPADRKTFLEYAFGKPKEEIEHSGGQELSIKIIKVNGSADTNK